MEVRARRSAYLALCLTHLKGFYDRPRERPALDLQELGTVDDIRAMVTEDVARRYPAFGHGTQDGPSARARKPA